ncbi:MAG: hypothetical protein ABWZ88_08455 [Variovorax sp.]
MTTIARMRRWWLAGVGAALLAACAAPQVTPEMVTALSYEALGPEMQMGEQLLTVWVPAAPKPAPGAPAMSAEATAALAAASTTMITDLAQVMARGAREPINLAVGGPDSALTAQVLIRALRAVPVNVPRLRIAFVGQPNDAREAAAVAQMRGAALHFEQAPK